MADFDPLGLVKAMGPQRDPYSWAAQYSEDAAKGEQLRKELKNRLTIAQQEQGARSKERAVDRAQQESIFTRTEAGRQNRFGEALKAGRYGGAAGKGGVYVLPAGSIDEATFVSRDFRSKLDPKADYVPMQVQGKRWHVPRAKIGELKFVKNEELGGDGEASPSTPTTTRPPVEEDPEEGL
jgi:hypothetical protein